MSDNLGSNIFPEKVVKTTGSNGTSYTSDVYSFEAWTNITLIYLVCMLIFIGISAPFTAAIFMIFYCRRINVKPVPTSHNLFGALAAIYMLVDYHFHWFFSEVIKLFFSHDNFMRVLYLNLALAIMHIILLLTGDGISKLADDNRGVATAYVIFFTILAYRLAIALIDNKIIHII